VARIIVGIIAAIAAVVSYLPHRNDSNWMLVAVAWAALAAEMFKESDIL
jgi:hypothetical protein